MFIPENGIDTLYALTHSMFINHQKADIYSILPMKKLKHR